MGDANCLLKELASQKSDQQQWCIEATSTFDIKSGLISQISKFHGCAWEDPNKHLMEFQWLTKNMIPNGANADEETLCAFPFSLLNAAKDWLYYLPPGSITTWNGLKRLFLERYFPASKAIQIPKEICGMKQSVGESLYECWERYKRLTVTQAREFIESMAANSQQFSSCGSEPPTKGVNQVDEIIELRQQMSNVMAVMQQVAAVVVKPSSPAYENVEHVNAIFSTQSHPSEFQQQVQQPQQAQNSELARMVTLVEALMSVVQQNQQLANLNQQKTDNAIKELRSQGAVKDLQTQVGSMIEEINQLHAQNGEKLPSQPLNPRDGVNAITFGSGTRLVQPEIADLGKEEAPKELVLEEKDVDFSQTFEWTNLLKVRIAHLLEAIPPEAFFIACF
ncbi:uncharacterized protein LOC113294541 [Papaver somniferum]|uniref:uncharacterized protein LOC113294541 n=1 Tax=Papaver somniferum TaxID=3469 RepID=UPI000E6FF100|nr:uncharacterized protein LOC113294541 [Papaver somniferum]